MMKTVSKIFKPFLLTILLFLPTVTMAEFHPTLNTCTQIANNNQRLACFDSWVQRNDPIAVEHLINTSKNVKKTNSNKPAKAMVKKVPLVAVVTPPKAAPKAPPKAIAPAKPSTINVKEDFGLEHKKVNDAIKDVSEMKFVVAKSKKTAYGNLQVTFINGQVWKSISSERTKVKKADVIIIQRGALNSFLMSKEGTNRTIRVKRIK